MLQQQGLVVHEIGQSRLTFCVAPMELGNAFGLIFYHTTAPLELKISARGTAAR